MATPLPLKTLLYAAVAVGGLLGGAFYARPSAALEAKVDQLVTDMAAVKCKLNVGNTCPPERK